MTPTTLVLLPGLDGTGRLFAPLVAALPPELTPQVVSYPLDEVLHYPALVDRVQAALPQGRFVLVGESFSGPIALAVGARNPPGLCGVALVASFVQSPVSAMLRHAVSPHLIGLAATTFLVRRYLAGDGDDALVDLTLECMKSVAPEVLSERVLQVLSVDARDELRACPAPLLYLAGAEDRLVPRRVADELQAIRPELRVETLEAPHLVLQRAPASAARELAAFAQPSP